MSENRPSIQEAGTYLFGSNKSMPTISWLMGTICGIGYAPVASGTVASAVAALFWYWWYPAVGMQLAFCGVMVLFGLWASDRLTKRFGEEDPSRVVVDEVAGMWLALLALPRSLPVACAAFLLFRVLDIAKIPPMKQLERLPGGLGIMMDDVAAGLITRLILGVSLLVVQL